MSRRTTPSVVIRQDEQGRLVSVIGPADLRVETVPRESLTFGWWAYKESERNKEQNKREGWECPQCGRVMAPWMPHCDVPHVRHEKQGVWK